MYEDMTMEDAEKTGDRKIILLVMRRLLANALDNCGSREISAIAGRLAEVVRELDDMGAAPKPDEGIDEFTDAW